MLLASSASEALGVHAFLGAFLIGVALGDGRDEQKEAHHVIGHFVMSFAPIYFILMGMTTNFITNFDPILVVLILVVACVSKLGAVLVVARAAVVMALVTSLMAGPMMSRLLWQHRAVRIRHVEPAMERR